MIRFVLLAICMALISVFDQPVQAEQLQGQGVEQSVQAAQDTGDTTVYRTGGYCEALEPGFIDEDFFWRFHRDILPKKYAFVASRPCFVYSQPYDDLVDKRPKRVMEGGFLWVSLEQDDPIQAGEIIWYQINPGEYVLAQDLKLYEPSKFAGRHLDQCDLAPGETFGWIILGVIPSAAPGQPEDLSQPFLHKYQLVRIYERKRIGDLDWYRIGPDKWIEQRRIAKVTIRKPPEGVPEEENWIDVDLYEQTLVAYQGRRPIFATIVSSGLPEFGTNKGLFRVWVKRRMGKMSGGQGDDYYFLEDVPYHIYFDKGIAIHGSYWHDSFGIAQSHGCVNVSPRDAKWLYDWTSPKGKSSDPERWIRATSRDPGTWVWVH